MLSIVIRNLITNVIKFSNPGNTIHILLSFQENHMVFSIRDEGIGMSAQHIENLFKIKTKSSIRGTRGEKGTGLGLLLCKDFIESTMVNYGSKAMKILAVPFIFHFLIVKSNQYYLIFLLFKEDSEINGSKAK